MRNSNRSNNRNSNRNNSNRNNNNRNNNNRNNNCSSSSRRFRRISISSLRLTKAGSRLHSRSFYNLNAPKHNSHNLVSFSPKAPALNTDNNGEAMLAHLVTHNESNSLINRYRH